MIDYYRILRIGIVGRDPRSITSEEIEQAYQNELRSISPLRRHPEEVKRFQEIQQAYAVLANEKTRSQYDIEIINLNSRKMMAYLFCYNAIVFYSKYCKILSEDIKSIIRIKDQVDWKCLNKLLDCVRPTEIISEQFLELIRLLSSYEDKAYANLVWQEFQAIFSEITKPLSEQNVLVGVNNILIPLLLQSGYSLTIVGDETSLQASNIINEIIQKIGIVDVAFELVEQIQQSPLPSSSQRAMSDSLQENSLENLFEGMSLISQETSQGAFHTVGLFQMPNQPENPAPTQVQGEFQYDHRR